MMKKPSAASNTLTLHYLQAFVLTAELGSVSAAARALGKRQSQVSLWVQELEIELAQSLFIRSGNSLQLSAAGQSLLPLAQHTLAQSTRLQAAAAALRQQHSLVFHIGVARHIPQPLFAEAIARFIALHPQVQLRVTTHSEDYLQDQLAEGGFDLILVHESLTQHSSSYDYCRVGYYDEVMVVRTGHPLLQQPGSGAHLAAGDATGVTQHFSSADLAPYRELVCSAESPATLDESGYSGQFSLLDDFPTLRAVLCRTDSLALLPLVLVQADLDAGLLQMLPLAQERSTIRRRLELRWPLGSQHQPLTACWLALLQQTLTNSR